MDSILSVGDKVVALRDLDPTGSNVRAGTCGIVFEPQNAYGDGGGPMVRWSNGTSCNVYPGDVSHEVRPPLDVE